MKSHLVKIIVFLLLLTAAGSLCAFGRKNPFTLIDFNEDNKISKEEWIEHHIRMFEALDTDKSGSLSEEEMKKGR